MSALPYLMIGLGLVNFIFVVWMMIALWVLHRRLRHAQALDSLLARLCIQAFANSHAPIWTAWTAVMGDIEIEVKQNRRMPE